MIKKLCYTDVYKRQGGKFGQGGYKTSGGLHGVGSSVVNALSSWLEVEITRDGSVYRQRFENGGHPVTGLEKIGKAPKSKTGTKVTFMPDASIFSTTDFKFNTISERLKESAFLLKNVTMTLTDLRGEEEVREAVSYTHLDVYKRQILFMPSMAPYFRKE